MRELDRLTIEEFGVPGEILMDLAGFGLAAVVDELARKAGLATVPVLLVAGRGNNGGDVFVAARYLIERDYAVEVWIAGDADRVAGDALTHLGRMRVAGITPKEVSTKEDWDSTAAGAHSVFGVIVDGVLGTGISGPARGPAAGAIRFINGLADTNLIVAVDVPSGLNADTGEAAGDVVVADATVTMGLPKSGLIESCALDYVGNLEVVDIGIPAELSARMVSNRELITADDMIGLVKRRPRVSHKGTFGHVLILGGAAGYAGAAAMATEAACRSGVGLVTALVPSGVVSSVASNVPEAMVHGSPETESGSLSSRCFGTWSKKPDEFDAVLIGPGMTTHEHSREIVESVLSEFRQPLVVDADALNVVGNRTDILRASSALLVLTPHPGEMARLLGCTTADIQADRFGAVLGLAEDTESVVVLKGAGTLVAAGGRGVHVNMTGNPGMAKAGMGDVLGGFLAGLLAQGLPPFDAARLAVYLHGRAGDNAAWQYSQSGMAARDVIDELAGVFLEISVR